MTYKCVSKGVILAAGYGSRLNALTQITPKVLIPVLGKPLILYPIESLVSAGIKEIAVVIGHLGEKVKRFFHENPIPGVNLHYVHNMDHHGGNAISVKIGGEWAAGEPFVLCMGDHIIHRDFVSHFLGKAICQETLGIDFNPGDHCIIEEATKVKVNSKGIISSIGKGLIQWDAIDTGVFLLTESFVSAVMELSNHQGKHIGISEVICFMLKRGQDFLTVNTSGLFWADIDTKEDMKLVESANIWLRMQYMTDLYRSTSTVAYQNL